MANSVHPAAWWVWALLAALAAGFTTNPLVLGLIITVMVTVTVACAAGPGGPAQLRFYLALAGGVLAIRMVFRLVFAGTSGGIGPVLVQLPMLRLPGTGIALFGPLHLGSLISGFEDGLRLATMIVAVGVANVLATPRRTLAALPGAFRHIGTAVVVALTVFPQLARAVVRLRKTAALRERPPGQRAMVFRVIMPLLADALDQAIALAAALEARGYGAGTAPLNPNRHRFSAVAVTLGVALGAVGLICLLGGGLAVPVAVTCAAAGVAVAGWGTALLGTGVRRSVYRPQRWGWADSAVVGAGLGLVAGLAVAARVEPGVLAPATLVWPGLAWTAALGLAVAITPAGLGLAWLARAQPSRVGMEAVTA